MSEIKRWEPYIGKDDETGSLRVEMGQFHNGEYVLFTDHEADLIKAKIEVLEEEDAAMLETYGGVKLSLPDQKWRTKKIAQLQAQLGEAGR